MKKRGMHGYLFKHNHEHSCNCGTGGACGGGIYFLGFIGSCVYYFQQAPNFWQGVLGFLKAIVWPAFLVFKLFGA
jgi:CO dehydrogenase/acetyl-CoA synthase beta subunit